MRRPPFLLALGLAVVSASPRAFAQGTSSAGGDIGGSANAPTRQVSEEHELTNLPKSVRISPRAPTLPDLTHTASELAGEHTIASVKPHEGERLASHLFHFDFEIPLVERLLYVGGDYGFAAARSPEHTHARFVSGQPQVFGRVVWVEPKDKYALGAGLGVIAPIVTYDSKDDGARLSSGTASSLIGIVRPWDISSFLDRRVTLRPWIDLRVGRRRFVAQFRQGVDISMRTGVATQSNDATGVHDKVGDIELLSISTLYLGWQPSDVLAIGVEAWEIYLLKTALPITDRDRSVFAISPGLRFTYRWVEPGVSVLFPIGPPLLGAVDSYMALRIDLRVWFWR
jgi:hypothetical protein